MLLQIICDIVLQVYKLRCVTVSLITFLHLFLSLIFSFQTFIHIFLRSSIKQFHHLSLGVFLLPLPFELDYIFSCHFKVHLGLNQPFSSLGFLSTSFISIWFIFIFVIFAFVNILIIVELYFQPALLL